MGNGQTDYMTTKLFLPLSAFVYDWTGFAVSPYVLLFTSVALLAAVVLYVMKSA